MVGSINVMPSFALCFSSWDLQIPDGLTRILKRGCNGMHQQDDEGLNGSKGISLKTNGPANAYNFHSVPCWLVSTVAWVNACLHWQKEERRVGAPLGWSSKAGPTSEGAVKTSWPGVKENSSSAAPLVPSWGPGQEKVRRRLKQAHSPLVWGIQDQAVHYKEVRGYARKVKSNSRAFDC